MLSFLDLVAITLGTIAAMCVGLFWYSKLLFGRTWVKLIGMNSPSAKLPGKSTYAFSIAAFMIMSVVILLLVRLASDVMVVLTTTGMLWLGFTASTILIEHAYSPRGFSWRLFFINTGYYLVSILVISVIVFTIVT